MKLKVHDLYTGEIYEYRGSYGDVLRQLHSDFRRLSDLSLEEAVRTLNRSQNYHAEYEIEYPQFEQTLTKSQGRFGETEDLKEYVPMAKKMSGLDPVSHPAYKAAQFLAGAKEAPHETARHGLLMADGDYYRGAALSYGLPDDKESVKAIRSVIALTELNKKEDGPLPEGKEIYSLLEKDAPLAEKAKYAFANGSLKLANLGGKHSKGSILMRDNEGYVWLLKPGSGRNSPAEGVQEEGASQTRREAAFYDVAKELGLDRYVPYTGTVSIDAHEYAMMKLLPLDWTNLQEKYINEPNKAHQVLLPYIKTGVATKWGVLDGITGNPDRHGQNIMVSSDDMEVALIDHGSAFAGPSFSPAKDHNSFIPYYLRTGAGPSFRSLPMERKLYSMPHVGKEINDELKLWLNDINVDKLKYVLQVYGIDPLPALQRLARIRHSAQTTTVANAVNLFWLT